MTGTRKIRIDQITDVMDEAAQLLVKVTTLEWTARVKKATPVDTGRLRNSWQTDIKTYEGIISNNLEYAEPVVYGENLPPSWGGKYRTRQQTVKGYPEIIGKELTKWVKDEYEKIKGAI
tara:strand:+ start:150 stop:506 length:357 start_codon:yes stop_codon:yes gene_type:complete